MADLIATTGLKAILDGATVEYTAGENFEDVYQHISSDPSKTDLASAIEAHLRTFFSAIVIPRQATLYDRLLLSLRPKDYIASFNWDPLLVQAYKRNRHLRELPCILFLHGNVAVGVCAEHRQKGFLDQSCPTCKRPFEPVRLLYPIRDKDYDADPFICNEWTELRAAIEHAYMLMIYGYAAPASDVAAKDVMLAAWKANQTFELAEIDIIDVKSRPELEAAWQPFFVRNHYGVSATARGLFLHARRSCDHFAMATLQQQPCTDSPLPDTDELDALQEWVKPLIAQEVALRNEEKPFPC